jgi:hypothetical protein
MGSSLTPSAALPLPPLSICDGEGMPKAGERLYSHTAKNPKKSVDFFGFFVIIYLWKNSSM